MKSDVRITKIPVLFLALCMALSLLTASCSSGDYDADAPAVVVFHSYGEQSKWEGRPFRSAMERAFSLEGYHPRVFHFYPDFVRNSASDYTNGQWREDRKRILNIDPAVIIVNDDPAMEWMFGICDSIFKNCPVVYAGVSLIETDSLASYPLMSGFTDQINIRRNAAMLADLLGFGNVLVELDRGSDPTSYDNRVYRELERQLEGQPRLINEDSRLLSVEELEDAAKEEKLYFSFLSFSAPSSAHRVPGDSEKEMMENYQQILSMSNLMLVKYDVNSNLLVDRLRKPQIAAIRDQFMAQDNTWPRVLGGYFTSLDAQVNDQVRSACRIMNGERPMGSAPELHHQEYWLDWSAVKYRGLDISYKDYRDKYNIVNAPLSESSPGLYYLLWVLVISAVVAAVSVLVVLASKIGREPLKKETERLRVEMNLRKRALESNDTALLHVKADRISFLCSSRFGWKYLMGIDSMSLDEFKSYLKPESLPSFESLLGPQETGMHRVRLHLDMIDRSADHWWEMFYNIPSDSENTTDYYGLLTLIDDIVKDELSAREIMEKANEVSVKETFLANVSHDIRTPLNAISGFSELLMQDDCTPEDKKLYTEIISSNTEQLVSMIEGVLKMSQEQSADMTIKMLPVDIGTLVRKSWQTNRILCPNHLSFTLEEPSCAPVSVNADSLRITQVINNFLSNAFKYTPQGSVRVGWNPTDDGRVEVWVQDTGLGISDDKKESVLKRFEKADEANKGTGIGLSICRNIIEMHGGTLDFESRYGVGSRFRFCLPIYNKEGQL